MDGVHDMGGVRARFGPVPREANEPVFHAPWEGRTYGIRQALEPGLHRLGGFRYAIEKLDAHFYLNHSYYERWLEAVINLSIEKGLIGEQEFKERLGEFETSPDARVPTVEDPAFAQQVKSRVFRKRIVRLDLPEETSLFQPGDLVRVRDLHPRGHIRLPGYLKGKTGVIERNHGYYDVNDHEREDEPLPPPLPLYSVSFDLADVWGAEAESGQVVADLWEHYLEAMER